MSSKQDLGRLLACCRCRHQLLAEATGFRCPKCGLWASTVGGVVNLLGDDSAESFFDSKVPTLLHNVEDSGVRALFYEQQAVVARELLNGAAVVLDVGCGPRLLYGRPAGSLVIGLDRSYPALLCNEDADLRLFGSATHLPLLDQTVDAVICVYVLHHLVGNTCHENVGLLHTVLREFARVLRPGGSLLIFDVAPWWPVWTAQRLAWNTARRMLGRTLDMFFWPRRVLERAGRDCLPHGTAFHYQTFQTNPWATFPPIFAVQRLRLPRLLYPFTVGLCHWRIAR